MSDNWISVKDRLPEISGYYQVYAMGGQDVANFSTGNVNDDYDNWYNHRLSYPITHWQPLPDPPQTGQEADRD